MIEQTKAQAATFRAIDDHFEPLRIGKIEVKLTNPRGDVGTGTLVVSTYVSDSACFFVAVDDTGQLVSVEGPSSDSAAGCPRESLWDEPIGREFRRAASQLNTPSTPKGQPMIEQTEPQKRAIIALIDGLHATNIVIGDAKDYPGAVVAKFETASSRRNYGSAAVVTISAEGEAPLVQLRHVIEAGSGGFDVTDETEKPYGRKVREILAAARA